MKGLIPIGKFCKTMNVSHKSLRYYEEQGVLVPAYVNQQTGYRYYKEEQLMILYLVLHAIDIGIPLSKVKQYFKDNSTVDRGAFTRDAINIAKQEVEKLNKKIIHLTNIYDDMLENEDSKVGQGVFTRALSERYFLTDNYATDFEMLSPIKTHECLMKLFTQAKELGLNTLNFEGFFFTDSNPKECQVILEIPQYVEGVENIVTVPAGEFCCEHVNGIRTSNEFYTHLHSKYDYLILKKNYTLEHKFETIYFEIQKL